MKLNIQAIQMADSIRIADFKKQCNAELIKADSDELFYQLGDYAFLYVFRYGVVCFCNANSRQIEKYKKLIQTSSAQTLVPDQQVRDSLVVNNGTDYHSDFDNVSLNVNNTNEIQLTMLHLSQSVALDYFSQLAGTLLEDTRLHTNKLEQEGKLAISGKRLKKFIGKVLNIKNKISEHLYIFDAPDQVWDDEQLQKVHKNLTTTYDLKDRYRTLEMQLDIVKENLELFKDIMFHKESSKLEWIIIILILVEVVDMFVLKMMG